MRKKDDIHIHTIYTALYIYIYIYIYNLSSLMNKSTEVQYMG